jgi:hypothetical protein
MPDQVLGQYHSGIPAPFEWGPHGPVAGRASSTPNWGGDCDEPLRHLKIWSGAVVDGLEVPGKFGGGGRGGGERALHFSLDEYICRVSHKLQLL